MKRIFLVLALLCASSGYSQNTYLLDSTVLTSRVIKDSLDVPWEIIWGPDDHIWCTERFGRVSRINPLTGYQQVLLNIYTHIYEQAEAGMLGMVLHPNFNTTPHVFIAYTYVDRFSIKERLVKYFYDGMKLNPIDTLLDNIEGATTHIGCRLIFLEDNTLLMTTGDAQNTSLPQNQSSLVGKILRLNMDGSIPVNNPNPMSYVYSTGHRNAQGLWLAPNGIIYSSEHGPTTDDELNIIQADKNYGWPNVTGFCNTPPEQAFCNNTAVTEPLVAWTPTIAPSDIIWYDHPAIPEFKNKLLMTVLKDKSLIAFDFNATGDSVRSQTKYFKNDFGRLRDVCISPDGRVYLATNGSSWSNTNPFTHEIIELRNASFTGVHTFQSSQRTQFNPNPIQSGKSLNLASNINGQLSIYDPCGKLILNEQIQGQKEILIPFKPGVYYWVYKTEGESQSGKLQVIE